MITRRKFGSPTARPTSGLVLGPSSVAKPYTPYASVSRRPARLRTHTWAQPGKSVERQRGLALAISLILLIAMTIVGIATMSGTRLNEKITSNSQQKAISFEVAESAIARVWSVTHLLDSVDLIPPGVFNDPVAVVPAGLATQLSDEFDQVNGGGSRVVDLDAAVTIQYCGETTLPSGSSLSADESKVLMAGAMFDVNGTASIVGSKAESDHLQRGYIIRPRTGRTGACITPGV